MAPENKRQRTGRGWSGVYEDTDGLVVCRIVHDSTYTRSGRNGRIEEGSDDAWKFCDSSDKEEHDLLEESRASGVPVKLMYNYERGTDDVEIGHFVVTKEPMMFNKGSCLKSYVLRSASLQ